MKLFIDTASLSEIEDSLQKGIISGVTTNPSLLAKEPKSDFYNHIQKIAALCKKYSTDIPLSVEVFASEPNQMFEQGLNIKQKINYSNINIKIPVGYEELAVIKKLSGVGIDVNCTCCFTATQMQLAAMAGAKYVSLFYNRALDTGSNPSKILNRVRKFIDTNELNSQIIAGSIRNSYDLEDCWDAGAHIVTAGYSVIKKSTKHLKTNESVDDFLKDFKEWIK
jgi:transaldolase